MSRARAHANIALVKYWGKRDRELNLPAAGSLSLTLGALTTETEVSFGHDRDRFWLAGNEVEGAARDRLSRWLDIVRERAEISGPGAGAEVRSENDFPTASGLASSASAYAALSLAASDAAGLVLDDTELSILARRGSGSAARSIFGGLVAMRVGLRADGRDSYATPIDEELADWPLRMVVAIVGGGVTKSISSRDAMTHCAETSPLYRGWLDSVPGDLAAARGAIERRDLDALGEVCEQSALAMHAAAMASRPAISYFEPATIALMDRVRQMRTGRRIPAFFTMDAGPHVKVLTSADHAEVVADGLRAVAGVTTVIVSEAGGRAAIIDEPTA